MDRFCCDLVTILPVVGLHHDDCYDEDIPDVKEALRRLPAHLVDERNFRIMRAMQLSIQKTILPKEEWVKFEEVSTTSLSKQFIMKVKLYENTEETVFVRMSVGD